MNSRCREEASRPDGEVRRDVLLEGSGTRSTPSGLLARIWATPSAPASPASLNTPPGERRPAQRSSAAVEPDCSPESRRNQLPWELPPSHRHKEPALQKQILMLSQDEHCLLEPPCAEAELADFDFDWDSWVPTALACLEYDGQLAALRFRLVPSRLPEQRFWRNWAAHVHLIRRAILSSDAISRDDLIKSDFASPPPSAYLDPTASGHETRQHLDRLGALSRQLELELGDEESDLHPDSALSSSSASTSSSTAHRRLTDSELTAEIEEALSE